MKYFLLALIFAMSVFAQAYEPTNDLDKPFSGAAGIGTLAITKSANSAYMKSLTIESIINIILGKEKVNGGNGTLYLGTRANASNSIWNSAWDTTYTDINDLNALKSILTTYVDRFPASTQLLSATLANGETATVNEYQNVPNSKISEYTGNYVAQKDGDEAGTKNIYTTNITKDDTLSSVAGDNLTIYAGRNTSANNSRTEEVTFRTSGGIFHIYAYDTSTPIVLDLDGDGELQASKGQHLPHTLCVPESELVAFDINADGFEELVEWVGENDGLLVHDIVNNEVSAKNLFGDATGFKDGFEQLATLDANKDGALTGEELAGLSVWQDKNRNAKIDAGEILSLESLGITKLNVEAIELTATFERNGKYYMMWDWNPVTIMVKKAK